MRKTLKLRFQAYHRKIIVLSEQIVELRSIVIVPD